MTSNTFNSRITSMFDFVRLFGKNITVIYNLILKKFDSLELIIKIEFLYIDFGVK